MRQCSGCPLRAKHPVQSAGNRKHPLLAFVGEAPGEQEQEAGRPFVGPAGRFLKSVLVDLGLPENECFFTNVCMCKPFEHGAPKPPTAEMIHACEDGLWDELESVDPKMIVLLGNVPAKAFGRYERSISQVHGEYREIEWSNGKRAGVVACYHPSAVVRTPDLFRDFSADVQLALSIAQGSPPYLEPPISAKNVVETQRDFDRMSHRLENSKNRWIAIDLETSNRDTFGGYIQDLGIAWGAGPDESASIDWKLVDMNAKNRRFIKQILVERNVSMQTGSFDYPWLKVRGYDVNFRFDTEIAHWLLDERTGGHDLDRQSTIYFRAPAYKQRFRRKFGIPPYVSDEREFERLWTAIPDRARRIYNATDAHYTWRLTQHHLRELKNQDMLRLSNLLVDATKLYAQLYIDGMWVDWKYVDELEQKFQSRADAIKRKINKIAPDVNINAPKQLAAYLFDKTYTSVTVEEYEHHFKNGNTKPRKRVTKEERPGLQLSPFGVPADNRSIPEDIISKAIAEVEDPEARDYWQTRRISLYEGAGTKDEGRGLRSRSTSAYMLYWLAQQHPYPRSVVQYKQAVKNIRTYIKNIRKYAWPDGRIRPDYKLDGTVAGRFKTSRPAVHNYTAGTELYDMYTAPPGYVILHADYHQADMRIMCHFSDDDVLLEWLKDDPHSDVAAELAHVTREEFDKRGAKDREWKQKYRIAAKMINFGAPYGRSEKNLAPQMGVTVKEAKQYIKDYWKRLRKLKAWIDSREQYLLENDQELTSPFGNKRRFPLIQSAAHLRECARLAVNFPIMATVNYLTCLGHIWAVRDLQRQWPGVKFYVYPHIHDSMNICVPEKLAKKAAPIVAEALHRAPRSIGIDVPFPVEVASHFKWGQAQHNVIYDG